VKVVTGGSTMSSRVSASGTVKDTSGATVPQAAQSRLAVRVMAMRRVYGRQRIGTVVQPELGVALQGDTAETGFIINDVREQDPPSFT
jgi:hypothetical protein